MNLNESVHYATLLEKITHCIWREPKHFPVVPCTYFFGHLFWEIIMAVSLARRENKVLVLLKPEGNNLYPVLNEDVFNCSFNCRTENRPIQRTLMRVLNRYELVKTPIARFLFKVQRKILGTKRPEPVVRFHRCGIETSNFVLAKIKGTQYYYDLSLLPNTEPTIMLTRDQREEARGILEMHGFDFSTWFAVGHVREAGYRGYDAYNDARNFSQTALLPLVKHVARKGGFLVRLGTKEQSHIPKTRGIFDYARSDARSNLVDLYLMEKSRYYVGSSSGTMSLAFAFGKPAFIVNYFDFLAAGFRKCDIFIPKMLYCVAEHRILSIAEYCEKAGSVWDSQDNWFVDNSMEDIDEAFSSFLEFVDNGFTLSREDQQIYQEWIALREKTLKRLISEKTEDVLAERFKDVALATLNAPAILAPSFLRKHLFS